MLVPLPPMLDRVVVEEEALPGWLRREGRNRDLMDARRGGRLLLRADIERLGSPFLTNVLERVPGLKVEGDVVYVPRARRSSIERPCAGVVVYLDGSSLGEVDNMNHVIRPSELEAIEVLSGRRRCREVWRARSPVAVSLRSGQSGNYRTQLPSVSSCAAFHR